MTVPELAWIPPPGSLLTRVAWRGTPIRLELPDPMAWSNPGLGGRFDSPDGSYLTYYFATDPRGAFSEKIAPYARAPLAAELGIELETAPDPEDFAETHQLVKCEFESERSTQGFVDLERGSSIRHLEVVLRDDLVRLELDHLGAGQLKGDDRRITRLASGYLHDETDAVGIRYLSQLGGEHECWAIFGDRVKTPDPQELEIQVDDPEFQTVWQRYIA